MLSTTLLDSLREEDVAAQWLVPPPKAVDAKGVKRAPDFQVSSSRISLCRVRRVGKEVQVLFPTLPSIVLLMQMHAGQLIVEIK